MIVKASEMKPVRREHFQEGPGGGYAYYAISPEEHIEGSHFQMASRMVLDPGAGVGSHVHHNNEEIYFILEGTALYTEDEKSTTVEPGDILVLLRGHKHAILNTGSAPLVFLAVIAE